MKFLILIITSLNFISSTAFANEICNTLNNPEELAKLDAVTQKLIEQGCNVQQEIAVKAYVQGHEGVIERTSNGVTETERVPNVHPDSAVHYDNGTVIFIPPQEDSDTGSYSFMGGDANTGSTGDEQELTGNTDNYPFISQ